MGWETVLGLKIGLRGTISGSIYARILKKKGKGALLETYAVFGTR